MESRTEAIQDVVKRFTTELLNVIQHNDRIQDSEGIDRPGIEPNAVPSSSGSTMSSAQLKEELVSLQKGAEAALHMTSPESRQTEDEENLHDTVKELIRLHLQSVQIIEYLQRIAANQVVDLQHTVDKRETELAKSQRSVEKYREKYRSMKAEKIEVKKNLEVTRAELEQAKNLGQAALFDVHVFLGTPHDTSHYEAQPPQRRAPLKANHLYIPSYVRSICATEETLTLDESQVVWDSTKGARCLVVYPTHTFNPALKNGSGLWERPPVQDALVDIPRITMDIFVATGKTLKYKGPFECAGHTMLTLLEATSLGFTEVGALVQSKVITAPDMVPPNIVNMVRDMYNQGVLKLECFGFRIIAPRPPLGDASQQSDTVGPSTGRSNERSQQTPKRKRGSFSG